MEQLVDTKTYFIHILMNSLSVDSCVLMKSNYGGGRQWLCKHIKQLCLPCGLEQSLTSTWHHRQ